MTPAQRKYDEDLVMSMKQMAVWIEPRSRKVSITLRTAAERIEALLQNQPASTPDDADKH